MHNTNTIIVSPSGNFYGSEQVLYNHLKFTNSRFNVYVPRNSIFDEKLKLLDKQTLHQFDSLIILYVKLYLKFFFKRNYTLYINEGGHIKYAKLLAKLLPFVKVIVHIRLTEDTTTNRLGKLPKNVVLISISNFINDLLLPNYNSVKIYDPIDKVEHLSYKKKLGNEIIKVGIIGRVSSSKGLTNYEKLFDYYFNHDTSKRFHFIFFGDVMKNEAKASHFFKKYDGNNFPDIEFRGFVKDQDSIYSSIDIVLHLNEKEPLGRIGLESWARDIPFICFNSGGCGEINQVLCMEKFSVEFTDLWEEKIVNQLSTCLVEFSNNDRALVRENLKKHFSIDRYIRQLEKHF